MTGTVKIPDLINYMKQNNLVLVSRDELNGLQNESVRLELLRKDLMRKKAVTYKQIVDAQLLPVRSKSGVASWVNTGKIKADEVYAAKNGVMMVLTSAIKRLSL